MAEGFVEVKTASEIADWMERERVADDWPQPEYREVPDLLRRLDTENTSLTGEVERLRAIIEAKTQLLTAYRVNNHRLADKALAKLEVLGKP